MRKLLLSPKWWGLHILVFAAVLVMLRLGLWQWHRAQSASGGIQNWAYTFQWPLFAGFALVLWWKTLRIELKGQKDETGATARPLSGFGVKPYAEPDIRHVDGVRVGIGDSDVSAMAAVATASAEDEETRVYNAYLARLNAHSAAVTGRRRSPHDQATV